MILCETGFGLADGAQNPGTQIGFPPDPIMEGFCDRVEEEAVDREIASSGVGLGIAKCHPIWVPSIRVIRFGAERGDLELLSLLEDEQHAKLAPHRNGVGEQRLDLIGRGVKLALGASVYDPADPMGKMFFNILATFAEFEADLIRLRTREGMAIARAKGKLRGKQPKLSDKQQKELRRMHGTGDYSISDLAEVFSVSRPTIYRTIGRQNPLA